MRRDGFWTHIESKFGKTAANHMHRQTQEVITQWNVPYSVRSIKNALQENKMYQDLKLFKDGCLKQDSDWNVLAAEEQITLASGAWKTIPALWTQLFMFTCADLDAPSPPCVSKVWLSLCFRSPLSPLSSNSHSASFASAPPLSCLPFHFSSAAILAGDERHYFSKLLHPGGHCLAFGRRW